MGFRGRQTRIDRRLTTAGRHAVLLGAGFLLLLWSRSSGAQAPSVPPSAAGTVQILCVPESAQVESPTLGHGPCPFVVTGVAPGSHALVVSAPGYESQTRTLDVEPDAKLSLEIGLTPAAARLRIEANGRSGTVEVNGVEVGSLPLASVPVLPGTAVVVVRSPGCAPWTARVPVQAGKEGTVVAEPTGCAGAAPAVAPVEVVGGPGPSSERSGGLRAAGWTTFALGVAGLAVGTGFGLSAMSLKADLNGRCPGGACPASANDDLGKLKMHALASTLGIVVGSASAVTGIVLLIVDASKRAAAEEERPVARVVPTFGLGQVGAAVAF